MKTNDMPGCLDAKEGDDPEDVWIIIHYTTHSVVIDQKTGEEIYNSLDKTTESED